MSDPEQENSNLRRAAKSSVCDTQCSFYSHAEQNGQIPLRFLINHVSCSVSYQIYFCIPLIQTVYIQLGYSEVYLFNTGNQVIRISKCKVNKLSRPSEGLSEFFH